MLENQFLDTISKGSYEYEYKREVALVLRAGSRQGRGLAATWRLRSRGQLGRRESRRTRGPNAK